MNWHSIVSYAIGFFTLPVLFGSFAAYCAAIGVTSEWLEARQLIMTNYWTGFWLFIGCSVIAGTIVARWLA